MPAVGMVNNTHYPRDAAVFNTPSPFSPRLIRVMGCLLGGCAIASLFYGPGPLIVGIISLVFVAALIQKWSRGGR